MFTRSELTFNKLDSIETSANVCDLFGKQRIRNINLRAYEMFQIDIYLLYTVYTNQSSSNFCNCSQYTYLLIWCFQINNSTPYLVLSQIFCYLYDQIYSSTCFIFLFKLAKFCFSSTIILLCCGPESRLWTYDFVFVMLFLPTKFITKFDKTKSSTQNQLLCWPSCLHHHIYTKKMIRQKIDRPIRLVPSRHGAISGRWQSHCWWTLQGRMGKEEIIQGQTHKLRPIKLAK